MTTRLRLDALLREKGMTAKELADLTGLMESTISEWRTNKVTRISRKTLATLCDALDCTPGDLIEYVPTRR